jgi:hypothetical protein
LFWVFHDPGIVTIPYFVLEITRESLGDWPKRLLEFQVAQLQRIDEIIEGVLITAIPTIAFWPPVKYNLIMAAAVKTKLAEQELLLMKYLKNKPEQTAGLNISTS